MKRRSKKDAIRAARRLVKTYGTMIVWRWRPGLWTFAPARVAPRPLEHKVVS